MPDLPEKYTNYLMECSIRRRYIHNLKVEWRRRIEERKKAVAALDAHVKEARDLLKYAESFPPPTKPV